MAKEIHAQIEKILNETPYLPLVFTSILSSETFLAEHEEMIDCLCFEREGYDVKSNFIVKHKEWQPTTFIVATNYGVTILIEGGSKISDTLFGYRITHIPYEHIIGIGLDVCFLEGELTLMTRNSEGEQLTLNFNTAKYHQDCERFIDTLRQEIFERAFRASSSKS